MAAGLAVLVALVVTGCLSRTDSGTGRSPDLGPVTDPGTDRRTDAPRAYIRSVEADRPTAHLLGVQDLVAGTEPGRRVGSVGVARGPDGVPVPRFDGRGHLVFPSSPAYSIGPTGQLTVELWVRPAALQFRLDTGGGYVHLAQKGEPGRYEWDARMYSRRNPENRPNRISGYAFSPRGGLGAGSYAEDPVRVGRWIHLVVVIDERTRPGAPGGTVRVFKDGVLRDVDGLAEYRVRPRGGGSPLRVGAGFRGAGRFEGAIGDVVFYHRALTLPEVRAHWYAMLR